MRMVTVFVALILAVTAVPALADPLPPVNGIYNSPDQVPGGQVLAGRFSEYWAGGAEGALTNTIDAQSWDGAQLGTQWKVWCPAIAAAPVMVSDTRVAGTGDVVYNTIYSGGRFWLSPNGPWSADNLEDFSGNIQSFTVVSTHQYLAGTRIGVRSNITLVGLFDQEYASWDPRCMDYSIENGSIQGSSPAVKPLDYPDFLDPAQCPNILTQPGPGAWGTVTQITLVITGCAVPTETATWGSLKSRYED